MDANAEASMIENMYKIQANVYDDQAVGDNGKS